MSYRTLPRQKYISSNCRACKILLAIVAPAAQVYLNLVLEFVPETVYRISKHYAKNGQRMPPLYVKLYVYQMCRALGYIHSLGVCHRDIKPQACIASVSVCSLDL